MPPVLLGLLKDYGSVTVLVSLINIGVTIYLLGWRFAARFSALETKVNVIWDFLYRRAMVETVLKGWGRMGSPLEITPEGAAALRPFLGRFMPTYSALMRTTPTLSDRDLFAEFERHFGDFLMERVCIPHGLTMGTCLIAALKLCQREFQHGGTREGT